MKLPALVGSARLDDKWGTVQVMGAAVKNTAFVTRPNALVATLPNAGIVEKWGYALGTGLKLNLPMLGAGDEFWFQGTYANGALDWVISNGTSSQTSDLGVTLPGLLRVDRNLYAFGRGGDGTTNATSVGTEQTKAWQLAGMLVHYWAPSFRQLFIASYLNITPGAQTRNTDWSLGGMSKADGYVLSTAFQWFPVKDFEIGLEIGYNRLNQKLTGTNGAAPSVAAGVPANFQVNPGGVWLSRLRVERTF
jgi:hypothetical protein